MPKFGALNNSEIGDYTRPEWQRKLEEQGFLCFWCGNPICDPDSPTARRVKLTSKTKAVPDHLCPRSRGGVNFIWNIVAACEECNRIRNNRMPGEFLRDRGAFAQPVRVGAEKPTAIPYLRERDESGEINTFAHLELSNFAAQVIHNLDQKMPRIEPTPEEWKRRKKDALDSLARFLITRQRQFLEAAGQMQLRFDVPKPAAGALFATEAAALTVRGMHITERRKA